MVITQNHSHDLKCCISVIEAHAPNNRREEVMFSSSGSHALGNNTVEYQRGADRQTLRCYGPLSADFTVKVGNESRSDMRKQLELSASDSLFDVYIPSLLLELPTEPMSHLIKVLKTSLTKNETFRKNNDLLIQTSIIFFFFSITYKQDALLFHRTKVNSLLYS